MMPASQLAGIAAILWSVMVMAAGSNPPGGALSGDRPRIIISTDIGGRDPDDFQSMVHFLVHSDLFDTEGLISSPPDVGRVQHILETIAAYEADYDCLRSNSPGFPSPDALRSTAKQGAINPAPVVGYSTPTEGSNWIIQQASRSDPRPLYILVWGSITDLAQAIHDDPQIKSRIRVYSIGSWNTQQDLNARNYLYEKHNDFWWIEADTTFRGMYVGGDQSGDLGNVTFVEQHEFKVRRRGIRKGQRVTAWFPMAKGVANLYRYAEVSWAANRRYLDALAIVDDPAPLHQPIHALARPVRRQGRCYRGFNPACPDDIRLFAAVLRGEHLIGGFSNRDVRFHLLPHSRDPAESRRHAARISRLLKRLHVHGLIAKIPRSRRWRVTHDGHAILTMAVMLHDQHYPDALTQQAA